MKFFILFILFISTTASAKMYIKESESTKCDAKRYFKISDCGSDCIPIKEVFNCKTAKKEEILKPDYDSPIVSKSESEPCSAVADDPATTEIDESKTIAEDCQDKLAAKVCSDLDEVAVKVLDEGSEEVYCTKTTYPMIGSGRFHVVEDPDLKASYDTAQAVKAAKKAKKTKGQVKRQKCSDSLSYISGSMDDNTEAQNDAVEVAFGSIQDALVKCRFKKAKRLIGEVADPAYAQLKADLLEILE